MIRTEEQIEARVEKTMDILDKQYINGDITTPHYEFHVKQLNIWADGQYAVLKQHIRRIA